MGDRAARSNSPPSQTERQFVLEEAAGLIERRIGAIRGGIAPLHVVLELESAARAIRTLATDLDRLAESRGAIDEGARARSVLYGPPVLQRVSRGDP